MAAGGENRWPYLGRNRWPLTLGAPVRLCVSQRDGEATRIDLDQPTSFFSQIPELQASTVPALLDEKMIGYLREAAS
jgi:hypothetical protein